MGNELKASVIAPLGDEDRPGQSWSTSLWGKVIRCSPKSLFSSRGAVPVTLEKSSLCIT